MIFTSIPSFSITIRFIIVITIFVVISRFSRSRRVVFSRVPVIRPISIWPLSLSVILIEIVISRILRRRIKVGAVAWMQQKLRQVQHWREILGISRGRQQLYCFCVTFTVSTIWLLIAPVTFFLHRDFPFVQAGPFVQFNGIIDRAFMFISYESVTKRVVIIAWYANSFYGASLKNDN